MQLGQGNVFTGVCDSVHRGGVPGLVRGVFNFSGGVLQFWGGLKFFLGGPIFLQFFFLIQIFFPQNFFWDAPTLPPGYGQ